MKARFFRLFSAVLFLAGFAGMILSFTVADHPAYAESKRKPEMLSKSNKRLMTARGKLTGHRRKSCLIMMTVKRGNVLSM